MPTHQAPLSEALPKVGKISVNWKAWGEFNFDVLGPQGVLIFQFLVHNCVQLDPKYEGWFYHSKDLIKEKTGVKRETQDKITKYLESINVLERQLRGLPARLHFEQLAEEDTLWLIYQNVSPHRYEDLRQLYLRCSHTVRPDTRTELRKEKVDSEYAEAMLDSLIEAFETKRGEYNNRSREEKATRVLANASLPKKPAHIKLMADALAKYNYDQIEQGFLPYCDLINFANGGIPKGASAPSLKFAPPTKDILSYFLSTRNDYEVLRSCITASFAYGHTPE